MAWSLGSKPETLGISLNLVAEAATLVFFEKKKRYSERPVPTSAQQGREIVTNGY